MLPVARNTKIRKVKFALTQKKKFVDLPFSFISLQREAMISQISLSSSNGSHFKYLPGLSHCEHMLHIDFVLSRKPKREQSVLSFFPRSIFAHRHESIKINHWLLFERHRWSRRLANKSLSYGKLRSNCPTFSWGRVWSGKMKVIKWSPIKQVGKVFKVRVKLAELSFCELKF